MPRDSAADAIARGAVEVLYAGTGEPCFNQVYLATRAGSEIRPRLQRLVELIGGGGVSRAVAPRP